MLIRKGWKARNLRIYIGDGSCSPKAAAAFAPYLRSNKNLSSLVIVVDAGEDIDDNEEYPVEQRRRLLATYQNTVDQLYLAAAENHTIQQLLSETTALTRFDLITAWEFCAEQNEHDHHEPSLDTGPTEISQAQAEALASGFLRNNTLERVYLRVKSANESTHVMRTVLAGLNRHPCLKELVIDSHENELNLSSCISTLLG